jgi:hypothetical protein
LPACSSAKARPDAEYTLAVLGLCLLRFGLRLFVGKPSVFLALASWLTAQLFHFSRYRS